MPSLVAIESFTTPWEAHIARGRLEAEGIPAEAQGLHMHVLRSQITGVRRNVASQSTSLDVLPKLGDRAQ